MVGKPINKSNLILNTVNLYLKYVILWCVITPLSSRGQDIVYNDHVYKEYEEFIKTTRLFPFTNGSDQELLPPIISLNGSEKLLLEFDDLFSEYERYYVKFIHCNSNWEPSRLFPLDYLNGYNEFPIEEYEFSFNTLVPYIHYTFLTPKFKASGNYLLIVYKDSEDNLVLSRRMMVYDQKFSMDENLEMSGLSRINRMTQEIQFTLYYRGSNIPNPAKNVTSVIRQNQRWDNAIENLRPTNVWENSKMIEYKHFALENQFQGGSQFRFFDLRSIEYFGRNVETVDRTLEVPLATLMTDRSRLKEVYSEYADMNGKYTIRHPVNAEYAYTEFFLESGKIDGQVFIGGSLNNWDFTNPMRYLDGRKAYYASILLKEGFYDYQYVVKSPLYPLNYFEGDHFETENEYDILIYFYSFELNADLLWGYFPISRNARR